MHIHTGMYGVYVSVHTVEYSLMLVLAFCLFIRMLRVCTVGRLERQGACRVVNVNSYDIHPSILTYRKYCTYILRTYMHKSTG